MPFRTGTLQANVRLYLFLNFTNYARQARSILNPSLLDISGWGKGERRKFNAIQPNTQKPGSTRGDSIRTKGALVSWQYPRYSKKSPGVYAFFPP
jgi:hypothetical protein